MFYLSSIDKNVLKKLKNFKEYFSFIRFHISYLNNIEHLCSLNLLMKKIDFYNSYVFNKQIDYLLTRIMNKLPDEAFIASMEFIKKNGGEKTNLNLEQNVKIYLI